MQSRWHIVGGRPMHALVGEPTAGRHPQREWNEPIVMAHGLGVAAESLRSLADEMVSLGHRCFVPDQPGFGLSTGPEQPPPLDMPGLADALAAWMRAAGIEQAALFGNSIGAQIAADFAARYPDRTSAVLLIGPTTDPAARSVPAQLWRWLQNAPRDRSSTGPGMVRAYRAAGLTRIARTAQYAVHDRLETKLPHIAVPTLVVGGSIDPIAPLDWVRRVCELLPAGTLVVIDQAGHSMQGLRPGELAQKISAFLDAVALGHRPSSCA